MVRNSSNLLSIFVATLIFVNYVHACGLSGAFCGRGPKAVNCCAGYLCDIAPNDAYARCNPKGCGATGAFCGRGPKRVNCCDGYFCNATKNDGGARCTINPFK